MYMVAAAHWDSSDGVPLGGRSPNTMTSLINSLVNIQNDHYAPLVGTIAMRMRVPTEYQYLALYFSLF